MIKATFVINFKDKKPVKSLAAILLFALYAATTFSQSNVQAKCVINVKVDKSIATVQPTMWGIFFEDINMGADGGPGNSVTIYFGKDSLVIPYINIPYTQVHYIPIQSPKRKIIYSLHFNQVMAGFPLSYMEKNKGNVQFEIPEVYELANIIWTLSPSGQRASDLYKEGSYYARDYLVHSHLAKRSNSSPIQSKENHMDVDSTHLKNYENSMG